MLEQVNYTALDSAKAAFIEASRKTMPFARRFGFVPDEKLGASANIFALDLKPFLRAGADKLYITLLPEGLGTADDARPDDLSPAELTGFWRNIGLKTVACLTNDAASSGMQTILISLYLPSGNPEHVFSQPFLDGFLNGFVGGCKTVGCVWISGETPQLKGKLYDDKLDIAGALVGLMPPNIAAVDGTKLSSGNKIVFIGSSGPHENGFTTIRQVAKQLADGYRTKLPGNQEFWQAINEPSILYSPLIQQILSAGVPVTSIENVTGHGWQKLMRAKKLLRYVIAEMLPVPPVFQFIENVTGSSKTEMLKIFNYGVGCAIYVDGENAARETVRIAQQLNLKAIVAGEVVASERREVVVEPLSVCLTGESFALARE